MVVIDFASMLDKGEEDLLDYLSDGGGDENDGLDEEVDQTFPGSVMVVNLPQVDEKKHVKLRTMLDKMFDKIGACEKVMPIGEGGTTDGYMIVTYDSAEEADKARTVFNNFYLDKKHTLAVYSIDEFDEIVNYKATDVPKLADQEAPEADDLRDWLLDETARGQFVTRFDAGENEVHWHDHVDACATLEYGGEREKEDGKVWCDSKVQWSPWGGYLATFHRPGIALWGGEKFTKRARLAHNDVKHIEFSPNEEYVLTWNGRHAAEKDPEAVKVWRILTSECVATFPTPSVTPRGGEFPHFLWSPDGRFLARCSENAVFVYDAETDFQLCVDPSTDKKSSIKFPDGLHCFDWSPKENILSMWVPEKDNVPARLQLLRMPMRHELAAKNLFNVRDATMHWQPDGKYMCVNAMRLSKSKKSGHSHLEIFRVSEKNVPVETVEIKDQTVKSFHWETQGNRFCVLTTDESGHGLKARFYCINEKETVPVAVHDLSIGVSHVLWAPAGQYFIMAAIPGGDLLFGQLDPNNKLEILAKDEHFLLNEVHWDPSSRSVITAVTQSGYKVQGDAGYKVWQFQGKLQYAQTKPKLFQIAWRPKPPSLLTPEKKLEIKNNLKSYSKKYESRDEVQREATRAFENQERAKRVAEFEEVLARIREYVDENRDESWSKAQTRFKEINPGWVEVEVEDEEAA